MNGPARDPADARRAAQIKALFEHFFARDRDGAARNLLRAMGETLDPAANASRFGEIEADPAAGRPHPGPYPGVARWGYRWIKVRRYWFGYAVAPDGPVLTNVVHDAAELPGWVKAMGDDEAPNARLDRQQASAAKLGR